jgi:superfamily II DNA helicase RecQ
MTIIKELIMKDPYEIFVSPNRPNIKFHVKKVKKHELLTQLQWIVDLACTEGENMPKTIIFCSTLQAIASVVNWLMMMLGSAAFVPPTSTARKDCLIGIYHSLTLHPNKEIISQSLKQGGRKRIVVATSALSMGVNFPDIRNVVMFGPPRCILDFHQEAGRAGRDGLPSNCCTYFYGQQVSHCEDDVRTFLKFDGCLRVGAYLSLDANIIAQQPGHDCCAVCEKTCKCGGEQCFQAERAMSTKPQQINKAVREVNKEDQELLEAALREIKETLAKDSSPIQVFGNTALHGFSDELIEDILLQHKHIFTLSDILSLAPVFSIKHACKILEVFHEIFDDCMEGMEECIAKVHNSLQVDNIELLLSSEYDVIADDFEDIDFDVL